MLLHKVENRDVLLSIALHQFDEKAPQCGVPHGAQLPSESPQFTGILLFVHQELLRSMEHKSTVGPLEVHKWDERFVAVRDRRFEGSDKLRKDLVVTSFVFDEQVYEITKGI